MRSLLPSKENIPAFLTLGVVAVLACFYYFKYLPDTEASVKEWKFRTLQNVARNIRTKIETGHLQLQTYLKSEKLEPASPDAAIETLNAFLHQQRTTNFPITQIGPPKPDSKALKLLPHQPRQLVLSDSIKHRSGTYALSLEYNFSDFIKPLLPGDVFEHYIVTDSLTVLYETFSSGFDPLRDSIFTKRKKLAASEIVYREIAGSERLLFVQPVKLGNKIDVYVMGVVSKETFFNAKTRLPPYLILLLITIFTIILVTFPIIKLYQLGEEDRLTRTDAISVTVVSMFLLSMLFMCLVKYGRKPAGGEAKAKEVLAEAVRAAFVQEIADTYHRLFCINQLIESHSRFKESFTGSSGTVFKDMILDNAIDRITQGIDLDRVFWMDKNGTEVRTWNVDRREPGFSGQFKDRAYFKNIVNGTPYLLKGSEESALYVDQVVSWISGDFLTDISIASSIGKAKVAAISFRVKSLKDYKMPPAYTFAMIDRSGKVLYHSDSTRNLNENLFEEFSEEKKLRVCLEKGVTATFSTRYFGQEYQVLMKAVGEGLPYYLVIMENLVLDDYRDINVYSFTISMQMLVFLLITIQVLVMFLASAKRSLFKGQMFETDWIGPKESSNWEYIVSTAFNILLFIGLCAGRHQPVLCQFFVLLVASTSMPVFLNFLFAYKYHNRLLPSKWYKIKAGLWGISIPVSLNVLAAWALEESWTTFWTFEIKIILIPAVLCFSIHALPDVLKLGSNKLTAWLGYNQTYTTVLVSWMLVTMGIPMVIFFNASYNYDQHLIARSQQLNFLNAYIPQARLESANRYAVESEQEKLARLRSGFYFDGYWLDTAGVAGRGTVAFLEDDKKIRDLLQSLRIYESERLSSPLYLDEPASADLSFYFNNLMHQVNGHSDSTSTSYNVGNDRYLWVASSSLNTRLPRLFGDQGFFLWVFFFLVLLGFYFVFQGLINKIFSIKVPEAAARMPLTLDKITDKTSTAQFFVVGSSRFGQLQLIDDLLTGLEQPPVKKLIIDASRIPEKDDDVSMKKWNAPIFDAENAKYELIIIQNFEYNFKNVRATYLKLCMLERLMSKAKNSKILILSAIHSDCLLASVLESNPKELGNHSMERWQELLGKFQIALNPVSEPKMCAALGTSPQLERNDSFLLKSVAASQHSYFSIWQSLSEKEKFFLYDLAEDGLVNSYDQTTLDTLLEKGLIVHHDGRLKFITRGFRHFILSSLGVVELGKIMEKVNDNRNWNRVRVPLVLVALTILAFILSSQREASTRIITSLGALVTVIPAIINFLGTLGGTNVKRPGA